MRAGGVRFTRQRAAVLAAIEGSEGHLGVREVLAAVRRSSFGRLFEAAAPRISLEAALRSEAAEEQKGPPRPEPAVFGRTHRQSGPRRRRILTTWSANLGMKVA